MPVVPGTLIRPRDGRKEYRARLGLLGADALRHGEAVVASHWTLEVSDGLLTAERRGRITAQEVARVATFLLALPIAVDPVERSRSLTATYRLARTRNVSAYDAAYLELSVRTGLPLATLDQQLRAAAGAEGVELFRPG